MDGDVKQFSNLLIYCCHMNTIGSVTALSQIRFKSVEACAVLKRVEIYYLTSLSLHHQPNRLT